MDNFSKAFGTSFETSKAYNLVYSALDYRSLRQDLIAGNMANVNTPYYRPKDVHFEDMLAEKASQIFDNKSLSQNLELVRVLPQHVRGLHPDRLTGSIFFRDGHLARNDGNSVDLDVETSELGKNSTMYQALTSALKKHKGIFAYALESGKNL
ncbi:flagellar basal body rod protein FlgB [Helicobacter sp. MIT 14-3879]|uniref:flagellar basal body rod protein FlgB n=1 Tax=Helicobacter sp. MIT 14-3879 TaxID=2040649 RepID=UPI000E1E667A|nr:flagellar basal body rod protein FlgB [Helicobacter sp. MIT 14-3879]RDU62213.1 flagellar basal body rod protein FlgB [Helicobacter sp. MIT 14-3879]